MKYYLNIVSSNENGRFTLSTRVRKRNNQGQYYTVKVVAGQSYQDGIDQATIVGNVWQHLVTSVDQIQRYYRYDSDNSMNPIDEYQGELDENGKPLV